MKKSFISLISAALIGVLSLSLAPKMVKASATTCGTTSITINNVIFDHYGDNFGRVKFRLFNEENVTLINGDPGLRSNDGYTRPTVTFNGVDYQFSGTDLFAAFAQNQETGWTIHLRWEAGNSIKYGASDPAQFYSSNYPGLTNSGDNVLTFHKDSIFGIYKIVNDFSIVLNRAAKTSYLVSDPHTIEVTGGTVTNGFAFNGRTCLNSGTTVNIKPSGVVGKVVDSLTITDTNGTALNIATTRLDNGDFTFVMPKEDIKVTVNYVDVTYTIDFEGTKVSVKPGSVIGSIPEGRWAIDGFEISDESYFMWEEDKVATRLPNKADNTYTITLLVDEEVYDTITFTDSDTKVTLPAIPYKEGYSIIGWDLDKLEYKDMTVRAIYEEI